MVISDILKISSENLYTQKFSKYDENKNSFLFENILHIAVVIYQHAK